MGRLLQAFENIEDGRKECIKKARQANISLKDNSTFYDIANGFLRNPNTEINFPIWTVPAVWPNFDDIFTDCLNKYDRYIPYCIFLLRYPGDNTKPLSLKKHPNGDRVMLPSGTYIDYTEEEVYQQLFFFEADKIKTNEGNFTYIVLFKSLDSESQNTLPTRLYEEEGKYYNDLLLAIIYDYVNHTNFPDLRGMDHNMTLQAPSTVQYMKIGKHYESSWNGPHANNNYDLSEIKSKYCLSRIDDYRASRIDANIWYKGGPTVIYAPNMKHGMLGNALTVAYYPSATTIESGNNDRHVPEEGMGIYLYAPKAEKITWYNDNEQELEKMSYIYNIDLPNLKQVNYIGFKRSQTVNLPELSMIGTLDLGDAISAEIILPKVVNIKRINQRSLWGYGSLKLQKFWLPNYDDFSLDLSLNMPELSDINLGTNINANLDFSQCHSLSYTTVKRLFDNLKPGANKIIVLAEGVKGMLTIEDIKIATDKGWTVK